MGISLQNRPKTLNELDPASAGRLIGEHLVCLPIESLPVAQCAGAVLRENVYAERDQPPFDRVAMDGIAISAATVGAGRHRFRIQGTQSAGEPPLTLRDATRKSLLNVNATLPFTGPAHVVDVSSFPS